MISGLHHSVNETVIPLGCYAT